MSESWNALKTQRESSKGSFSHANQSPVYLDGSRSYDAQEGEGVCKFRASIKGNHLRRFSDLIEIKVRDIPTSVSLSRIEFMKLNL